MVSHCDAGHAGIRIILAGTSAQDKNERDDQDHAGRSTYGD